MTACIHVTSPNNAPGHPCVRHRRRYLVNPADWNRSPRARPQHAHRSAPASPRPDTLCHRTGSRTPLHGNIVFAPPCLEHGRPHRWSGKEASIYCSTITFTRTGASSRCTITGQGQRHCTHGLDALAPWPAPQARTICAKHGTPRRPPFLPELHPASSVSDNECAPRTIPPKQACPLPGTPDLPPAPAGRKPHPIHHAPILRPGRSTTGIVSIMRNQIPNCGLHVLAGRAGPHAFPKVAANPQISTPRPLLRPTPGRQRHATRAPRSEAETLALACIGLLLALS